MRQQWLELDGARFSYFTEGDPANPPVVLHHGGGLSGGTWRAVAEELAPHYFCIAPDLRGHGDTDWAEDGDYSLGRYARDLGRLIEVWGLERPHLVGHSLGGQAALYAACHGLDLTSLTMVDVGPRLHRGPGIREINAFLDSDWFATFDEALDRAVEFRPGRTRDSLARSLTRTLRETPDGRWTWKWDPERRRTRGDRAAEAERLIPDLRWIGCPVLVVRGSDSDVMTPELATQFVDLLHGEAVPARKVTIPGAGHNVHTDQPHLLAAELGEFFTRTSTDDRRRAEPHTTR
jgi:pimeloyl-ACP methyl ester carboxylesterase